MLMRAGTFKARVDIEKSLDRTVEIPLATQNPAATVVDLLATIASKDATISKLEAIIAQKDACITHLLNSRSWKITSPLRKMYDLLQK